MSVLFLERWHAYSGIMAEYNFNCIQHTWNGPMQTVFHPDGLGGGEFSPPKNFKFPQNSADNNVVFRCKWRYQSSAPPKFEIPPQSRGVWMKHCMQKRKHQSVEMWIKVDEILSKYEFSFLPSTLNAWNKLPDHVKSCTTANQFKNELAKYLSSLNVSSEVPHQRSVLQFPFYCTGYYGKILNQIRYGLSPLNMQLFTYNINDNPFCPECHDIVEDSTHFFLKCVKYVQLRAKMFESLRSVLRDSGLYVNLDHDAAALSLIFNGLSSGSIVDNNSYLRSNELIYYAVISYMSASKRFSGVHGNNKLLNFEHWCTVYNIYFILFFLSLLLLWSACLREYLVALQAVYNWINTFIYKN